MAEHLFPINHSRAQSFFRCRKQYWFRYLSGLPKPPDPMSPSGIVGTGVHRAMRVLCDSGDADVGAAELDVYLRMPVHEVAGPGTEWQAIALAAYDQGVTVHNSIDSEDRWAEKDTHAPYRPGGVILGARIDRVDRLTPDHWQIIDWKTGRIDYDDTTDDQLDIGHVALRTSLRSVVRRDATVTAIAWNLRTGARRVRQLIRADAVATLRKYSAIAARIQANTEFLASPGPMCAFCEWRPQCPESDLHENPEWDDEPELSGPGVLAPDEA